MTIVDRKSAKQAYQESCEAVDRARIAEANGLAQAAVPASAAPAAPTAKPARRAKKAKK